MFFSGAVALGRRLLLQVAAANVTTAFASYFCCGGFKYVTFVPIVHSLDSKRIGNPLLESPALLTDTLHQNTRLSEPTLFDSIISAPLLIFVFIQIQMYLLLVSTIIF